MSTTLEIPELPRALRAPEPVIVVGMIGWVVATVIVAVTDLGGDRALPVCLVGLAVLRMVCPAHGELPLLQGRPCCGPGGWDPARLRRLQSKSDLEPST